MTRWTGSLSPTNCRSPYRWHSFSVYKRQVCVQHQGLSENAASEGCCGKRHIPNKQQVRYNTPSSARGGSDAALRVRHRAGGGLRFAGQQLRAFCDLAPLWRRSVRTGEFLFFFSFLRWCEKFFVLRKSC